MMAHALAEEKGGETRTASCASASLQRVNESRWQQQTGAERSVRLRRCETSSTQTQVKAIAQK